MANDASRPEHADLGGPLNRRHGVPAVADAVNCFVVPDGVALDAAVALPISYRTAYGALAWRAGLKAGERLLVQGAAGGLGLAAVETGKALGAEVIAVATGATKCAVLGQRGADAVIDGARQDIRERVRAITGNRGVDVAFDPVGGDGFHRALRCLGLGGRLLTIGYAGGEIPTIGANLLLLKNVSVMGFNWGQYVGWGPADERHHYARPVADAMATLSDWWSAGTIRPTVHARFDLARFIADRAEIQTRRAIGRVVLVP